MQPANHVVVAAQCIKSDRYRPRAAVNVHVKHQNGGENCDPTDLVAWLFGAGRTGFFRNCSSLEFFMHKFLEFTHSGARNKHLSREQQFYG